MRKSGSEKRFESQFGGSQGSVSKINIRNKRECVHACVCMHASVQAFASVCVGV